MALPMPKLWTPQEYDALPDDGVRPKPAHYAMSGIPWYWRVERGEKPKLVAYELPGGGNVYAPVGEFEDLARLDAPAPVEFSLRELLA